jgi:hypothetical protein
MRYPALAIGWQIWTRHRRGLTISAACLMVMIAAFPPLLRAFPENYVLIASMIPPVVIFAYIANLLVFTDEIGSLTSGYPRRMFTLPVTTASLAFWPMFLAVVVVVSLWFLVTILVYRPAGLHPPLVLPAVALALTVAWNQVICWSPIKSQFLRVTGAIVGLELLLGVPLYLFVEKLASQMVIAMLGLTAIPLVYGIGHLAIRHDRRGKEWSFGLQTLIDGFSAACDRISRQPSGFRAAEDAQFWYESRCHSLPLKASTLLVLGCMFVMYLPVPQGKTLAFQIMLGCMLTMPLILANSQGASLGRLRPIVSKQRGFITFQAMRPILTGDMIDAKYRMIARNVVQIWLLDLAITGTLFLIKGQLGEIAELFRSFMALYPGWKWSAILGLVIVLAPCFTWKLLTDSLVPGLTGRRLIADGSVFLNLTFLMLLVSAVLWVVAHPARFQQILPVLVWSMGILVLVKLIASLFVFRLALRRGLLSVRSVLRIIAIWSVMALATMLLAHLLIPRSGLSVARPALIVGTLSLLPLGRFALAPLALDWNRHR